MADLTIFDLTGRKALVTGASRGIGRAIAEALAAAGASVAITGRTDAGLQKTASHIRAKGGIALPLVHDVTEVEQAPNVIADAVEGLGGLDILVNNAGVEEIRPSVDVDEALWDRIVTTNLKGAFFVAQAAARHMRTGGGSIVNLCSLTSYVGVPTAAPYGSSKAGLLGMTRALAAEWAADGIRVNAIAPGYFHTDMTDVFYRDEAWAQTMLAKIPQRRFGALEDLSGVVVFLASGASAYITGQCIAVDGGTLASI